MFLLLGISGQDLFVDPQSKLIMVHTAVRKWPVGDPKSPEVVALWYGRSAIRASLAQQAARLFRVIRVGLALCR